MLRAVLIGFVISTSALSAGGELEAALAKMDQAAKTFKDLTADLKKTHHTAVIDENAVDSGTIFIKRLKPHDLLMRANITEPDPKQYSVDGREAAIYFPKSQTAQKYKIGDYKSWRTRFCFSVLAQHRRSWPRPIASLWAAQKY